ncbi:hypothetical protein Dip510_001848 [Elusimicrobium posterum]|uniref:hypothetical protein n=1 Tax=Elusimicrobium posterum TaxID=3116653 RepID=UPI003C737A77
MKKIQAFLVAVLFAVTANAAITVTESGQTKSYASKAVISAKYDSIVNYNGVSIFVPKGSKVELEEVTENGVKVLSVKGKDFKNITVGGLAVNANGKGAFVLRTNPASITVKEGNVTATPATAAQMQQAAAGRSTASQTQTQEVTVSSDGMTFFFNADSSNNAYTQSTQDANAEVLSPSAPR